MAKKQQRARVEPSRKEQQMTLREREQARRITIIVGTVLGIALVVLAIGLVYQFVLVPNSTVAVVGDEKITTRELAHRSTYDQTQYQNQLLNILNFQQQIDPNGEQGLFTSQIQQLQAILADSEGLANQVLERMIEERVILQAAAEAGVTVSDAEIDERIHSVVAQGLGGVTLPEATATAEALAIATATPTATPSPTPTTTLTSTLVLTPTATPLPTPTTVVVAQDAIDTAYQEQLQSIRDSSGLTEAQYRQLFAVDLLRTRLTEALGDQMPTSGERVQASHILIAVPEGAAEEEWQLALADAISITQRLNNGEDFAALAQQYSDDPGSAASGGDLGLFGRGQMVTEFEEAAFALAIGAISEPVRTQFGYHIITKTGEDGGEPDFNQWLENRKTATSIERRLTDARLPKLPDVPLTLLQQ
jgi:parvulin-like peptidyl-prolyl isomerase